MQETIIANNTSSRLTAIDNNYSGEVYNLFPQSSWADGYYFQTKGNEPTVIDRNFSKLYLYGYNLTASGLAPIDYAFYVNDAIHRYKDLNSNSEPDVQNAKPFLDAVKELVTVFAIVPYIMFNKLSIKVDIVFNNKEVTLDYDYETADTVSILCQENGTLLVREASLDKLEETIRLI
jgi:hypothetical protein